MDADNPNQISDQDHPSQRPLPPPSPPKSFLSQLIDSFQPYGSISFFGYLISITILLVYTVCYYIMFQQGNYSNMIGVIDYLSYNVGISPIADITVTYSNCPFGYEEKILTTWPGTHEGCNCGYHLYEQSCSSLNKTNCSEVWSKSKENIKKWEDAKICVKRYKEFDISYNYACKANLKKCGSYLCIPYNESCPVTSVSVEYTNLYIPDSKVIGFSSNKYLRIYQKDDSPLLIDIVISFGDLPCIDASASAYSNHTYKLLKTDKKSCGKYGVDYDSAIIDSLWEEELYRYNGLLDKLKGLPDYIESISSVRAHLVARHRFDVKNYYECFNKEEYKRIEDIGHELSKTYTEFNIGTGISFVVQILFLMAVWAEYTNNQSISTNPIVVVDKLREKLLIICFHGLQLFLSLSIFLATYWKCEDLNEQYYKFQQITQLKCFNNDMINLALGDIANEIPRATSYIPFLSMLFFVLNVVGFALSFIDVIAKKMHKLKYN